MKIPLPLQRRRRSGVAIVLVLSILVLLTVVVVGFFTNATTDLTSSKSYSDSVRVKLLSDSSVNLVQSQIRQATSGLDGGKVVAWASQPGVIRTYDDNGNPKKTYKLFSSDKLTVDGAYNPVDTTQATADIPTDWNTHPSDFTDLNSPLVVADVNGSITDPSPADPSPADPTKTTKYSARFPIVDGTNLIDLNGTLTYDAILPGQPPAGSGDSLPDVEGFSVQKPKTYDSGKLIGPNNNPVPMPVRWLYVLQNGQLQVRDPKTGIIPGATNEKNKPNPVVGRIAFWTDDDTCKININTASEGTAWDRPYAKTATEVAYSTNMPVQNEFQAFPGHPSKTSLSTVLGGLWPVPSYTIPSTTSVATGIVKAGNAITAGNYNLLQPYYDLVPRVTESQAKGSAAASQPTLVDGNERSAANNVKYGIPYDADRLYTSVDELMFKQQMSNDKLTRLARNNTANTAAKNPLTPQLLETARFFLTTNNRAPEVTMLNTPRIALWPLQFDSSRLTAKEKLLAFCSTIPAASGNLYAIQRFGISTSSYPDNGSSNSATVDWTRVPRNGQIYGYLQKLMASKVPGLGGTFSGKYPSSVDQIETEMVDQIRSTTNLYTIRPLQGSGDTWNKYTDAGQVVPLVNPSNGTSGTNTQGFGRFSTITEAAIDFFRVYDPTKPSPPVQIGAVLILQPFNASPGYGSMRRNLQIEVLGLDQFTINDSDNPLSQPVKLGFPVPTPNSTPPNSNAVNVIGGPDGRVANGNLTEYNGLISSFYTAVDATAPKTLSYVFSTDGTFYPFFTTPDTTSTPGNAGTLNVGTTNFDFNPGTTPIPITINIYPNPRVPGQLPLQTLHMEFPPVRLPVPVLVLSTNGVGQKTGPGRTTADVFNPRIPSGDGQATDPMNGGSMQRLIDTNDIVRSVVVSSDGPSKGDFRMIAALHDVPSKYFTTHPFYFYDRRNDGISDPLLDPSSAKDANWKFAHNLRAGDNPGWGSIGWYDYTGVTQSKYLTPDFTGKTRSVPATRKSAYTGSLVANLPSSGAAGPAYAPESFPAVGLGTQGAFLTDSTGTPQPGDWDTGAGNLEDGPYIGKPDEGNGILANTNPIARDTNATSIYYSRSRAGDEGGATYSPNREISSAVIFGSLPTGIKPSDSINARPWQTLLFCANPAAGTKHPGFGVPVVAPSNPLTPPSPPYTTIPDFFLMDLFTMPIVEPYAISEPLSSQGKVNMNYQIAPFTYITRNTAVRAVMKSTRFMAIPSSAHALANYKTSQYLTPKENLTSGYQYRYNINPDENIGTLKAFKDRFDKGDIFRSAAEICGVPLVPSTDPAQKYDPAVPKNITSDPSSLKAFWDNCRLTGDNVREQPYGDLYPRLTTKSNTFTVHLRVQTLKKAPGTNATTFVDPTEKSAGIKDIITAEYRGSYQIERYVDPNIPTAAVDPANGFPDYATKYDPTTPANYKEISAFYKFHTIASKEF